MRLRRVEPLLRRALRGPCRMPPGARLLVAVSGGADSTALLVGVARIAPEFGLTLHAAHLHHGLRGAEADADLDFVRALCARLGVPLHFARRDLPALMERRGLSGENGLRVLRRGFLRAAAKRAGACTIATAHTADDQLETLLMRLLRGAGLRGLGAMRERHGPWHKPLLEATRLEIEADLRAARLEWREDGSNRDATWTRNRIRHEVIPALLGPSNDPARARAALAKRAAAAAREARDAERALHTWLGRSRPPLWSIQGGVIEARASELRSFPRAVRRLALRRGWRLVAPAGPGLTRRHLAALCSLVGEGPARGHVDLPAGFHAARERDVIRWSAGASSAASAPPRERVKLPAQGTGPSHRAAPRGSSPAAHEPAAIAVGCESPSPGARRRGRGEEP